MAQLVRAPPCHGGGRGFESHPGRFNRIFRMWDLSSAGRASALQAEGHRFEPCRSHSFMGGFPSGQRGQTVNLLQIASVVRIHLHPFALMSSMERCLARKSMQSSITQCVRWCGGIGRRKGLKIPRGQPRTGSSPVTGMKRSLCLQAPFALYGMVFGRCFRLTKERN